MTQQTLSSMMRFLKGRQLPDAGTDAPIARVVKQGNKRIVTFGDGTRKTYTKANLVAQFNKRLQQDQAKMAVRSIRFVDEKRKSVKVTIGGKQKGERKTYSSRGHALRAVERAYPHTRGFYVV